MEQRATDRLRQARAAQGAIARFVAALVLLRILTFALAAYFVSQSDITSFRTAQTADSLFGAIIDVVVLFLVLLLFDAIRRIDREGDRMQAFMDNIYRRLP